jgi:hypothetical protein
MADPVIESYAVQIERLLAEPLASAAQRERETFRHELSRSDGTVVVFGAGRLGRLCARALQRGGVPLRAFCDGNAQRQGVVQDGVEIIAPAEAARRFPQALFVVAGYVVILLSTNYIAEGDYHEGEYYTLLLSSVLGMMVMASARDLISIFIALELVSIPAYMLAAWRKRDQNSNEAGLKYYLMGVFASAILLYGMSLIFGITGSTWLVDIGADLGSSVS